MQIAVPITPSISTTDEKIKEIESDKLTPNKEESLHQIAQIIQMKLSLVDIQVQTTSSTIEFSGRKRHRKKPKIRSQSEERLQVIELLKYRHASGLKSRCYRTHNKDKRKEMFLEFFNKFESKIFKTDVPDNRKYTTERYRPTLTRIFRADVAQCKVVDDEVLKEILRDWISLIPLKVTNKFDAHKERKYIQYDFFNYLKRFANMPPEHARKGKLRADILNRLKIVTLESKSDKSLIINRLADILIDKVNRIGRKRWDINISKNTNYETHFNSSKIKGPELPRDKELEDFVLKYTTVILQNSDINISELVVKDIEDELMDILMAYFKTENIDYDIVESDIACMLYDYGILEEQAHRFSQIFVKKLKETLVNNTNSHKVRSNTLIILPNVCCHGVNKEPDTLQSITDEDIAANLKQYTNELCQQINEWLNDMRIQIPESLDKDSKHEAINNLANDIVERHKYLELNPCNEINEEAEIENLKYQIFKWIKKLVAEDNLEPVQRASDLNNRIKRIPIPVITKLQGSCDKHPNRINNINNTAAKHDIPNEISKVMHDSEELGVKKQTQGGDDFSGTKTEDSEKTKGTSNDNSQLSDKCNINSMPCTSACKSCCLNEVGNLTVLNDCKDNDQLEAEYEQFVQNWVQKIPMNVADFEDEGILEKVRMGIYNGLWKVVSKLNCDPATYFNRFLYEDLLDDAIDDLLDCLPQSSDLISKRHLLKVEFIEKTISINDKIKDNEEASFKNKLIQNVITDLRKKGIADSQSQNSTKLHEDLQIIKLVEDYLLLTKFKNEDKIISEIYKNKLLKQIDDFVKDLKTNHANELKDIDVATYQRDLIAILDQVPLPSENTLNQEADDVLLNMEVEEWYQDLPIVSNNDNVELYQRKKQRDILVKKIKEVRSKNVMDGSENALRNEVSRFLEKTLMQEGESLNINFMVDELVNRLKNKTKNNQSVSTKKVEFRPLDSYDQFSKDVPLCSSFIELPKSNNSLILQHDIIKKPARGTQYDEKYSERKIFEQDTNATKIQISDDNDLSKRQTRVVIQEPPSYRIFAEERPHSSSFKESSNNQWFSLVSSHPDVGTQTKNTNMYTISPYTNNETTQRNNEDNTETKDISETLQNSSFKISNNKQWLTLQRTYPDVGTQTSDINMYKQTPFITDNVSAVTTQTNTQKNIGFKDIPKCCQQSNYSFHRDKQEYKHIEVDASPIARSPNNQATSQTLKDIQHTQHTQPLYVSDNTEAATTRTNAQNKIGLEDIPKCCQKSQYSFRYEDKNGKINAINPNNQATSQTLTERKPYQLNYKEKPYLKDISEIGEDDKQIFIKEEDVSSLKCSIECQADNETKYGNQDVQHTLQAEISRDTLKGVDKAKFKVPSGTTKQTPLLLNELRTRDMQENEVRGKLDYDSDEEDIPCRCVKRYMKKTQKRYPCEAFDRLPYLPIFYPYPYFI